MKIVVLLKDRVSPAGQAHANGQDTHEHEPMRARTIRAEQAPSSCDGQEWHPPTVVSYFIKHATLQEATLQEVLVFPHAARTGRFTWHVQLATSIYTFTETFQAHSTALHQTDSNCNAVAVYLVVVNVVVYLLL